MKNEEIAVYTVTGIVVLIVAWQILPYIVAALACYGGATLYLQSQKNDHDRFKDKHRRR